MYTLYHLLKIDHYNYLFTYIKVTLRLRLYPSILFHIHEPNWNVEPPPPQKKKKIQKKKKTKKLCFSTHTPRKQNCVLFSELTPTEKYKTGLTRT